MCSLCGSASETPAVRPAPGSNRLAVRDSAGPSTSCGSLATRAGSSGTIPLEASVIPATVDAAVAEPREDGRQLPRTGETRDASSGGLLLVTEPGSAETG